MEYSSPSDFKFEKLIEWFLLNLRTLKQKSPIKNMQIAFPETYDRLPLT